MLQKCANPLCTAEFRYLHEGKLFEVETQYRGISATPAERTPRNGKAHVELYWFCKSCSARLVLSFDREQGAMTMRSHVESNDIAVGILPQLIRRNAHEVSRVLIRPFDPHTTMTRRVTREAA